MPFYPGPGLGGHCIPIDPFYLSWRAKQAGESTRFIELAGEINTAMPERVINTLEQALHDQFNRSLKGASILLIGLAYKNVDDTRESPAFSLIEIMETAVQLSNIMIPISRRSLLHVDMHIWQAVVQLTWMVKMMSNMMRCSFAQIMMISIMLGSQRVKNLL